MGPSVPLVLQAAATQLDNCPDVAKQQVLCDGLPEMASTARSCSSTHKSTFLAVQAAATWLLECPDVARQQLLWQKATQEDVMRREAAAQKEKEARKKLVSRCACPHLFLCSFPSIQLPLGGCSSASMCMCARAA